MDFKKKTLFIIIVVAVIIFMLVWKVASPLVESANKLGSDIKGYQEQISEFASYTNYMADLQSSYKKNEEKIERAGAAIVKDSESGKLDFLKEVENISDKTFNVLEANILNEAIVRKNVKKSPESKDAKSELPSLYANFALNLRVRGTFLTLLKMLAEVENMPYYNNIDSISVSSLADSKFPELTAEGNIKLRVFTKP